MIQFSDLPDGLRFIIFRKFGKPLFQYSIEQWTENFAQIQYKNIDFILEDALEPETWYRAYF